MPAALNSRFIEWRADHKGLAVIAISLLMIGCVTAVIYHHLSQQKEAWLHSQGQSLTRIISAMPVEQLVSNMGNNALMNTIHYALVEKHFAYISLVSPDGALLVEQAADGVRVPTRHIPREPAFWFGERTIEPDAGSPRILEFHAPLLQDKQLQAFVRLGFFAPGWSGLTAQLPFIATLAFLVFNLGCVVYFMTRLEHGQLNKLNDQLEQLINTNRMAPIQLEANGELLEFIKRFNSVMDRVTEQQQHLEVSNHELLLNSKLESFRNSRLNSILQTLPDAVFVLDDTGRLCFSNSKLRYYLNIQTPLKEGATMAEWCPYRELHGFSNQGNSTPLSAKKANEIILTTEGHTRRSIRFQRYPLFSPSRPDKTFGTLVVGRDITEHQLAVAHRGEFIAQVAHELKTPLNTLSIYSEALLGEDGHSTEFRIEACNIIHDETERLSNLINNLLNLSKLESGTLKPDRHHVRLHDLLKDALDSISAGTQHKDIHFKFAVPNDLPPLYLDKDLLRIAVINLLTNAIKYNRANGTVSLRAQETDSSIIIMVEDTGIGISDADRPHVFEKHFRAASEQVQQRPGHGLGLSLTREIVSLLHGSISVQSELERGSCFHIQFDKTVALLKKVPA
ncbi:sensor histidine kinase [Oceanimonas marisflavi]|uniref:sensor histidine kinase n=1 Tax=Oceanimonas marisflavi TaxID=2059724 RepID=UPI000D32708D|nr:ATP-binding protein [Oceanimonas marisflavi]